MTPNQQKYLIGQGVVGALVNLGLNAFIGWAAFRSMSAVPLSGPQSISGDLVATAFLLPFIVCLIVTPLVRAEVRKGKIPPVQQSRALLVRLLPRMLVLRGIALGLLAAATLAPLTIWALQTMGLREMGLWEFVCFKAAFAAALAALITPVIALRALMDPVVAATAIVGRAR